MAKNILKKLNKKISLSRRNKLVGEENPFFGKHHTEETKKKISDKHKGVKLSNEHIQKIIDSNNKKVYQIDINTGEIINMYNSIKEAAEELKLDRGSISKCCNSKRKSVGGFKWMFVEDYNKTN